MTDYQPAWTPTVPLPAVVPLSFDAMWTQPDWVQVFSAWADDQPGWTGPLTDAVVALADWGVGTEATVAWAEWILGKLAAASPPVDGRLVGGAQLELQGREEPPADLFAELYPSAYQILSQDQVTYAAFYNDVATIKAGKRPMVGPLPEGEEERPSAYRQRRVVWIQTGTGPQIMGNTEGEEDVWYSPPEEVLARIATTNAENVKDLANGGTEPVVQVGDIVLIGTGHNAQDNMVGTSFGVDGTVTVTKGRGLDPGTLTFTGMHDQDAVKRQVARFSQKKVRFG
jgi:hypothetical protein